MAINILSLNTRSRLYRLQYRSYLNDSEGHKAYS